MSELKKGMNVQGTNMDGNNIIGKLENIIRLAGVGIVRTGNDRTNITHCYLSDLNEQK
jgi:hypothetical protein